jgi:hypothetical protein
MTSLSSVAPSTAANTTSTVNNPVKSAYASSFLASEATTLALNAGVIVSLGGNSALSDLTYNATGIFNTLAQAGQSSSSGSAQVANSTQGSNYASLAVSLSTNAGVVSSLGGAGSLTYGATGLFNSLAQAGQLSGAALTPGANSQTNATQSLNQGILNGLPSTSTSSSTQAVNSGVYNSAGTVQSTSTNWANALKANPSLASTVIADSYNQGIVATL